MLKRTSAVLALYAKGCMFQAQLSIHSFTVDLSEMHTFGLLSYFALGGFIWHVG